MTTSNSDHQLHNPMDLTARELDHFTEIGKKAANAAGETHRSYFGKKIKVDDKNGDGPVTIADKKAEEAMASIILENFPSHAVFGEETGWTCKDKLSVPDFVWVLDPIDGTQSFIARRHDFGTLIALLYKGKPVLGIIDQPILKERWVGVKGRRTTMNGEEASVRTCEELKQAYAFLKDPHYNDDAKFSCDSLVYKVNQVFYDGNCMSYALLASGFIDLIVDCALDPFDFLALIPIVEGAGGIITDWEGRELCWEVSPSLCSIPEGGFKVLATGDKRIHEIVVLELSGNC
ncbi:bifunctional phosphatase IMPL2, chloroplastic-like [Tripterygium wilfordii]|uniref:bifunctional phosphatase IMPL2, chloroplastic-like n=1 Tax=Tripterygium wilfordii TaxID=458696 RepID=UPI0018F7F086|nr:bifunctional phosphatase IMPL2, chloroplastic-like [Tripterygium wilfordii]XP_038700937.1 bifunctional phosphatase IMPL2, chloroplastic-like [Tripterygium wilfordii]